MEKQVIWGYPRLCLCLFFALCWASCSAKHGLEAPLNVNNTKPADTVWYMEVKLIPAYTTYNLPFNVLGVIQPNDLQNDIDLGNVKTLVLRYRFADELQLQEIKNRLLATGRVADIRITTSNN